MSRLSILSTRFITGALFTAILAGTWDVWWHGAVGRDSFWEPPHILLYLAVFVAIIAGWHVWYQTRLRVWRRLAMVLLLVPLSAPFDELWHRVFGVENLSSPLVIWSPPHVVLILSISASMALVLSLIRLDKNVLARQLFGSLALAGILTMLSFLAVPLMPIGPWKLVGFWGAGVVAFLLSATLLGAQRWLPAVGSATLVAVIVIVLAAMGFDETQAPDVLVTPHAHPPPWLTIFAFLVPAVLVDVVWQWSAWRRGALIGGVWALLLFGFSSQFFEPQFQYPMSLALIAIMVSVLGGGLAGSLSDLVSARQVGVGKERNI